IDYLIKYNFPNILFNSLKKLPPNPGTQILAFSSIEIFGRSIIEKLLFFKNEKQEQLSRLKELSKNNDMNKLFFFSTASIQRKSQELFYQGIKEFYNQNYEIAKEKIQSSIRIFRDDFIYYWNLARVCVKLNLKLYALKNYRRTLRLLKISKVKNREMIEKDIALEMSYVKKSNKISIVFNPIITLDKYHSIN
ncbi:MAG: hypothetical protein ACFFD7_07770, partial [Candidatus Thorarchaeota archaeon]